MKRKLIKRGLAMIALLGCLYLYADHKRSQWPYKSYDKVVGYQFANPRGIGSPFATRSALDIRQLTKYKRKESPLNPEQTARLKRASFSFLPQMYAMGCYSPHHIFVFYSGDEAVAAVEVCFGCDGLSPYPSPPKFCLGTNWSSLASLAKELQLETVAPEDDSEVREKYRAAMERGENPEEP